MLTEKSFHQLTKEYSNQDEDRAIVNLIIVAVMIFLIYVSKVQTVNNKEIPKISLNMHVCKNGLVKVKLYVNQNKYKICDQHMHLKDM